ncbi:hypothetical protein LZ31DRAFT_302825 [Colletotrichum somersetense]|nr:hypothetical protein LZ31DRAFT_302825 [Colletotrichum somersetense]
MKASILALSSIILQVYADQPYCQQVGGYSLGDIFESGITTFSGGVDSSPDGKELLFTRSTDPDPSDGVLGTLTLTNVWSEPIVICVNSNKEECFSLADGASCSTNIPDPKVNAYTVYKQAS